jgi:hypothetical protein
MTTANNQPHSEPAWVDFDPACSATHPKTGSKLFVTVESGKRGPATFYEQTGFALFNVPWAELGAVKQWQYREW